MEVAGSSPAVRTKASVAQMEEQRPSNPFVGGSSPFGGTKKNIWGYSSFGRAVALQATGGRFEPDYLHTLAYFDV